MDRIFEMYGRPFKMVGELYYKDLDFLIPYKSKTFASGTTHATTAPVTLRELTSC